MSRQPQTIDLGNLVEEDITVEVGTDAIDTVNDSISIQKCITLLQSRPEPSTADLPAKQAESIINSLSIEQVSPPVMAPGFVFYTGNTTTSKSGQRAFPSKSADETIEEGLLTDTDVIGLGDTKMRLEKGTSVNITHVAYMPQNSKSNHELDLQSGRDDVITNVVTSDGYIGIAGGLKDGVVKLPSKVIGSDKRYEHQLLVLSSNTMNPHDEIIKGNSVKAKLVNDDVKLTYDLIRPFPVSVLRTLPPGTTFTEAELAVSEVGRTLIEVYGKQESESVRYLLSREPGELSRSETQESKADQIKSRVLDEPFVFEDSWGVIPDSETSRLKNIIGKSKRVDFENIKRFSVSSVDKASPDWKKILDERNTYSGYANVHDAFNTLEELNIKPAQLMVDFTVEGTNQVSELTDYSHLSHIKADVIVNEDDEHQELLVEGIELMDSVYNNEGSTIAKESAKLGATGFVQDLLKALVYSTGVRIAVEDFENIPKQITDDYSSKSLKTSDHNRLVDAFIKKGIPAKAAEVAANDELSLVQMKSNVLFLTQITASELILACVRLSLIEGRPAISDIRKDSSSLFSMSIEKGSDKSLTRYVSSVIDKMPNTPVRKGASIFPLIDAQVSATSAKKLPPNFSKLLAAMQSDWSRKNTTFVKDTWHGFRPDVVIKLDNVDISTSANNFLKESKLSHNDSIPVITSWETKSSVTELSIIKERSTTNKSLYVKDPLKSVTSARAGGFIIKCYEEENINVAVYVFRSVIPSFVSIMRAQPMTSSHKSFIKNYSKKDSKGTDLLSSITHIRDSLKKGVRAIKSPPSDIPPLQGIAIFIKELHAIDGGRLQLVPTFDSYAKELCKRSSVVDVESALNKGRMLAANARREAVSNIDSDLKGVYSELVDSGLLNVNDLVKENDISVDNEDGDGDAQEDVDIEYELAGDDSDNE